MRVLLSLPTCAACIENLLTVCLCCPARKPSSHCLSMLLGQKTFLPLYICAAWLEHLLFTVCLCCLARKSSCYCLPVLLGLKVFLSLSACAARPENLLLSVCLCCSAKKSPFTVCLYCSSRKPSSHCRPVLLDLKAFLSLSACTALPESLVVTVYLCCSA